MSKDKITEKKSDPSGLDCPAAQPLCPCGVRGCEIHAQHLKTMRMTTRRWRRRK